MKSLKKALALVLAVVFVLSMAACHPKDEVAISSGDYELTSAMYSYFLVTADAEAKNLIDTSEDYDTTASGFSYYKQKIEDKSYEEYVKDLALEKCLNYIVLQKLCDEAEVTLSDEDKESWESTAEYYWAYYYGAVFSENGIAYSTFEKLFVNDALNNTYFDHLYGEGGEKEVPADDIKTGLSENYAAVYMITHDYSDIEEPDVDAISKELAKYVDALKAGDSFADVKAEYDEDNKDEDSTTSSSTTSSSASSTASSSSADSSTSSTATSSEEAEEEKKPVDSNISILTKYEDTYTGEAQLFEKYDEVSKLAANEVALIHDEDAACYYIVVKKDVLADEYYVDALKEEILYLLKYDEFEKTIADAAAELDYKVNNYAVNQFKVKKIYDGSEA